MRTILALATGALLSTTVSAFAATITFPNPAGSGTCTETVAASSNSAAFIEGAAVTNHILIATVTPNSPSNACNSTVGGTAIYGEGFIGSLKPAGTTVKNGYVVGSYNPAYKVHYVSVISTLPAVHGTGTIDTFLNTCELTPPPKGNCNTLTYGGKVTYTRTQ
jgi:hypothetical protein